MGLDHYDCLLAQKYWPWQKRSNNHRILSLLWWRISRHPNGWKSSIFRYTHITGLWCCWCMPKPNVNIRVVHEWNGLSAQLGFCTLCNSMCNWALILVAYFFIFRSPFLWPPQKCSCRRLLFIEMDFILKADIIKALKNYILEQIPSKHVWNSLIYINLSISF